MNRASMLKSRIPDTHYCPRVGVPGTEREAGAERDRHGKRVCVRMNFVLWS